MSEFLHHEPCPNCQSSDNLGVWDDGHKWCFGCGHYEPADGIGIDEIESKLKQKQKSIRHANIALPDDFTRSLPSVVREWLTKYAISEREILKHNFGWSQRHERLIFPVFDVFGNLLMFQGRAFSSNPDRPRFSTQGLASAVCHIIGDVGNSVVVVEDLLSAIKVARQCQAMPLWGSELGMERLTQLSRITDNLVIWLDYDKAERMLEFSARAAPLFKSVKCIFSELDPKEYSNVEIRAYIEGCQTDGAGLAK